MVKLIFKRKYPFVALADIALRRQRDQLQAERDDLRERLVAAQQEKALALKQADDLRKQKERLRADVGTLKRQAETEKKIRQDQEYKIELLRAQMEILSDKSAEPLGKFRNRET